MKRQDVLRMPFLILFILIPIAEVYAFLAVGDEIGILNTLLLCVVTAFIGGFLVKQQGVETLFNAQKNLQGGKLPIQQLFDGFCLIIAGAMLLTPGFVTDIAGFLLLLPPFRQFLRQKLSDSNKFKAYSGNHDPKEDNNTIEGDFEIVEETVENTPETLENTKNKE